ncbi:MAG: sulfatase, partial [Melioribacteraceae bacterium]|nr:sulfatase [Melioribacteraceae bacterium]
AFPEYLRAAGYYCTNNFKTDYQFGNPKTIWDDNSRTAHYKNRPNKDQPFFAVFNVVLTHESNNWEPGNITDPKSVKVPPYYPDTEIVRKSIARSYDNISKMDSIAGAYLEELEELGLSENTIVFFWSDHGDGLPRGKRWLYDSGTKIPLIIRWPGVTQPESLNNELVSTIDLAPTVLSMAGIEPPTHMQGRIILGDQKESEPEYLFSHRDRFDEAYDMVRSVRSKKYLYIRNYYPEKPYVLWVPYRNRSPIMKELFRYQRENKLNKIQQLWMSSSRPPIEFYDVVKDPYQIINLANDETYKEQRELMSTRLDQWRLETKDLGDYSESELLELWWDNGVQPITKEPVIIPNTENNPGLTHIDKPKININGPAFIDLHCSTQGASITYLIENEDDASWKLYSGPIFLKQGITVIRAIACRYGYKDSNEMRCEITVN